MKMTGYTKLFGSIVASTIWREPHAVRIVWITMLAMANKSGIVEASLPGLADLARVTIDECRSSLLALESADEYSRTPDHEGRRIEKADGGWKILNHAKYRAKMGMDEKREYYRLKKQEQRKENVQSVSNIVQDCPAMSRMSRHTQSQSQSFTNGREEEASAFEAFWQAYPRKVKKPKAWGAFKARKCVNMMLTILGSLEAFSRSPDWTKDGGKYIPYPESWINGERWNDQATSIASPVIPEIRRPNYTAEEAAK